MPSAAQARSRFPAGLTAGTYQPPPEVFELIREFSKGEVRAALDALDLSPDRANIVSDPGARASAYSAFLISLREGDRQTVDRLVKLFAINAGSLVRSHDAQFAGQIGAEACERRGDADDAAALRRLVGVRNGVDENNEAAHEPEQADEIEPVVPEDSSLPELVALAPALEQGVEVGDVGLQNGDVTAPVPDSVSADKPHRRVAQPKYVTLVDIRELLDRDALSEAVKGINSRPDKNEVLSLGLFEEPATAAYMRARRQGAGDIAQTIIDAFGLPASLRDLEIAPEPQPAPQLPEITDSVETSAPEIRSGPRRSKSKLEVVSKRGDAGVSAKEAKDSTEFAEMSIRQIAMVGRLIDRVGEDRTEPAVGRLVAYVQEHELKRHVLSNPALMTQLVGAAFALELNELPSLRHELERSLGFKMKQHLPKNLSQIISSAIDDMF